MDASVLQDLFSKMQSEKQIREYITEIKTVIAELDGFKSSLNLTGIPRIKSSKSPTVGITNTKFELEKRLKKLHVALEVIGYLKFKVNFLVGMLLRYNQKSVLEKFYITGEMTKLNKANRLKLEKELNELVNTLSNSSKHEIASFVEYLKYLEHFE